LLKSRKNWLLSMLNIFQSDCHMTQSKNCIMRYQRCLSKLFKIRKYNDIWNANRSFDCFYLKIIKQKWLAQSGAKKLISIFFSIKNKL
jgi:hypothetical protein